jgi:putative transposase
MKSAAFTQLYIHLIFAPKFREALLQPNLCKVLYPYIGQTIKNKGHKSIIINGMPDHLHILLGLNPKQSVSDITADIKRSSSIYINDNNLLPGKFQWQEGYGAFSYSRSQLDDLYKYIENQHEHHKKITFKEEFIGFLKKFEIEYDERFLFDFEII